MSQIKSADLIVLGAGPAGLTAGMYGARAGLDTIVLDPKLPGGQMLLTEHILNYPGFPNGISGGELAGLFREQAEKSGARVLQRAGRVQVSLEGRILASTKENQYSGRAMIIATGCVPRHLDAPGEDKLSGAGISYCAVCDGNFFEGLDVMVVGGGDSALEEAAYLSRLCNKVYLVHRRKEFRAGEACQGLVRNRPNIIPVTEAVVEEFVGDGILEKARLARPDGSETWEIQVSGAFIYVGQTPNTGFLPDSLKKDRSGWIITNERLETSHPGVFAAGDVRLKECKQVSTAVGDGALAAINAEKYLSLLGCET